MNRFCKLLVVLAFSIALQVAAEVKLDGCSGVSLTLNSGWIFRIDADGSAALTFGAGDMAFLPKETFNFRKLISDLKVAIDAVPEAPVKTQSNLDQYYAAYSKAELRVVLTGASVDPNVIFAAFTPEVKSYIDLAIENELSDKARSHTNAYPLFTVNQLTAIAYWPLRFPTMLGAPLQSTPSKPAKIETPIKNSVNSKDYPLKPDQKELDEGFAGKPSGARGWTLFVLFIIAACLTYRFIKLRSGS